MLVDLHAHTTASDGSYSPSDLVDHAKAIGLDAVGITDHDTIAGWEEALAASARMGVELVPGVELSTSYDGGRFHLLGYYIRPASVLTASIERIQLARRNRNGEIFANLAGLGVPLEESAVRRISGSATGQLGRPHFALAMLERGYVHSTQEAFDTYLADGKPAYASKAVLTPQHAISQIHEAGGVAVWAHPALSRKCGLDELEYKVAEWAAWGLDAMETHHSGYTPDESLWAEKVCAKNGLLAAGGSDFHGASKPHVHLGRTETGGALPYSVLKSIKIRRDEIRAGRRSPEGRLS